MHKVLTSILSRGDHNCVCFRRRSVGDLWKKKNKNKKKSSRACQSATLITDSEHWAVIQRAPHFQGYSNFPSAGVFQPMLTRSPLFFCQVIALMRLCVSGRWHNQNVSVVWNGDSTHTHTHTRDAVTRSCVACPSTEISCVSSLDYCSGCQNPHKYTSSTHSHIHTHSIAYPNQALSVLSLLLQLSLWSFTAVWFFIPLHSLTSLFLNPPPPFF